MTDFATSQDGTRIAFDRLGAGPPLVLISGMFCHRGTTQALAERLSHHFTVFNYDRRGRRESADTAPYAVEREVEDLGALIVEAGGSAAVYGHSSGAGLALEAAAAGLPITSLVLHEPPYGADDEESRGEARRLAAEIEAAVAEDRRADAISRFLSAMGMPPEEIERMSSDPGMLAIAPTMPYDQAVMGEISRGGCIPAELARGVDVPTLVIAGGASPEFFRDTAARLAELMPNANETMLDGQDHGAPAEVVAPVVARFLRDA